MATKREKNLKPIRSKSRARRLGRKGGLVRSRMKNLANLQISSKVAKCKNCKALCILKEGHLKQNKNQTCTIPDARALAIWYNKPVRDENIIDKLGDETIIRMLKACTEPRDLKMLHDALMNIKKTDYPKANMNIDLVKGEQEITIKWIIQEVGKEAKNSNP